MSGVGGPIKQDRVWFFGSARKSVTQQYAAGIYWNKHTQPQSMLFEPDLSRPASSDDFYRDYSARLTVQATEKHKFVVGGSFQANCNCVRAVPPAGRAAGHTRGGNRARLRAQLQHHDDLDVPGHQPSAVDGGGRREPHLADEPPRRRRSTKTASR